MSWHREFWPNNIYTVVEVKGYIKSSFVKELRFYAGYDTSKCLFFSLSGALCVKLQEPSETKILGVISDLNFPVEFPIKLDNGSIIE